MRAAGGGQSRFRATNAALAVAVGALLAVAFVQAQVATGTPPEAASLRRAIVDLQTTFGARYPGAVRFLERLDEIEAAAGPAAGRHRELLDALRRDALLAHPLVRGQRILYAVRPQYAPDHHNTATMFQTGEINAGSFRGGGAIRIVEPGDGSASTVLEVPEGIARDLELDFDARRVIFSMRRNARDDYHIWTVRLDGSDLRQLTDGAAVSDIDPVVLPDGDIVFSSTREPKFCQCNRHIMANLFRMDAEGSDIHQIGRNALFEGHAALLDDGRLLYDRWEYVDRHFGPSFSLWTSWPDGTSQALLFGNNAWSPGMIADARPVPGTHRFIATYGSCHDRPWGALALIDPARGMDGQAPVVQIWPREARALITDRRAYGQGEERGHPVAGQIDNFSRVHPKYEDPYPLSDRWFLCSRAVEGERMGIFLIDIWGNEVLLHFEEPGCFDPVPVAVRRRPPALPARSEPRAAEAFVYVADVYHGTAMEGVPRGSIRFLRVVEVPPKLYWTETFWGIDATQAPAMNWNCTVNKRILGTVPVEPDGSAYFVVPADRFIYFQLLDGDGMMVQSMRSGTTARPGERVGCSGCHEDRHEAPPPGAAPTALRRAPSRLAPWYGSERDFNYLTEVQPVFDRRCLPCHDHGGPGAEAIDLSGDLGLVFNRSYVELRRRSPLRWFPDEPGGPKVLIKAVDDGPPEVLPPLAWGSHRSRLVDAILGEHHGVVLSREDIDRIVTWIDLNAPYYGSYASAYPGNAFGRSPLDDGELRRLRELTGVAVGTVDAELAGAAVSFDRPETSPCLAGLSGERDARWKEALAIIGAGARRLVERPRADMPGFRIAGVDAGRLAKYRAFERDEAAAREDLDRCAPRVRPSPP